MRLNGFQRILIITAAVLAAVVSSLLISIMIIIFGNILCGTGVMTTCLCRSWLPVLTAIIKVPGAATAGKELPPAIIPAVLFRFRRHTGRLRTFHR